MQKFKSIFSTFLLCFLFWIFYTMSFNSEELIGGAIFSTMVSVFSYKFFIRENPFWLFNIKRLSSIIAFIPVYTIELFKANWDVAKRELSKELNINPGIVKIETELKSDYGLALLANCITLTPGTITMDIIEEDDKCYMYIHWIDVATNDIKEASSIIKGAFEPWVRRIFK